MLARGTPLLLSSILALTGCIGETAAPLGPDREEAGGKADDFFSTTTFEFVVRGRATITLEEKFRTASKADREARLAELIGYRHTANAYFLTAYLLEKEDKDKNAGFGGFGGMAKAGSYDEMDIEQVDDLTFSFTFEQIIAGKGDLLDKLPLQKDDGGEFFVVEMGKPTNEQLGQLETDEEWFRQAPFADWNPDAVDPALKHEVKLYITEEEGTSDAWLDFPALFADGVLSVDVHFGYDYHNEYHRKHARLTYQWLRDELEFEPPTTKDGSPATNFDDYDLTDRTMRSTLTVPRLAAYDEWCDASEDTCEVEVQVRLLWGQSSKVCCEHDSGLVSAVLPDSCDGEVLAKSECPGLKASPTDPDTNKGGDKLEADFRASMRTADVIHFSGHSGPFYGFSMANWKKTQRGDISYKEIEGLEMPSDRYQLVIADGCDTYHIAQAFSRNPFKEDGNLDVVTTTAFGDADLPYSVMNMILHLVEAGPDRVHRPRTVKSLIGDLQAAMSGNPMFGIHFVDDNPKLHPYADPGALCEPCNSHDDCGAPGNRCVQVPDIDGFCAPACAATDGCGEATTCERVTSPSAHAIYEFACVPDAFDCGG